MKKSDLPVGRVHNNYIKMITDSKMTGVKIYQSESGKETIRRIQAGTLPAIIGSGPRKKGF
jgi:hypothetical protein